MEWRGGFGFFKMNFRCLDFDRDYVLFVYFLFFI